MAGGKIRLQRDHSESQRHLLMFRLTVHTQTTGSSHHIFLKVNVSVLTERWGKKGIFTPSWKEQIGWNFLGHEICVLSCPLLPKETISMPLPCTRRCFLQRFLSTSKNQNPTNRISGCPGCFNLAAWLRMTSGLLFIALEYKRGAPRPGHSAS